jgi:arylsulfatase A-like enzyme
MPKKYGIIFSAALLALLLTSCYREETVTPNIVLLISDDQSWTDYSYMGHAYIQTPRIDELAAGGLTLTRGYTTAPLCRPALASIISGLYPHQHGIVGNDPVFEAGGTQLYGEEWLARRAELNRPIVETLEQLPTLADLLGEAGYVSLQTGKWWEGHFSSGGFTEGMTHGDPARGGRHGDEGLVIGREGLDIIYDFMDKAQENHNPFFIWYAPFMPHAPHTPPDSLKEKYMPLAPTEAVANYWAMCEWFDISCGQLMDYVEEKGMAENTLFIYVTDNGWIQDPDRPNRYAPRSKREPYDMGIRTPIIYHWKGMVEPEVDESSLASSIDIVPTVLAACGLRPTGQMQGINMLDKARRKERVSIFAETYAHDFQSVDSSLFHRIIITRPWKLILTNPAYDPGRGPELYQLDEDPHEWHNRAGEHPELVRELSREVESWWSAKKYSDGRPEAHLRMDARDHGIVLRYGDGPDQCDVLGARDVWVFEDNGTYFMHYDAAGPGGWLSSLAVSKDLVNWEKKGPVLDFGKAGEEDAASASYGVTYSEGNEWHMFYLGTPNASPPPDLVPSFPYLTLKARGSSPEGPWIKQKTVVPFRTKPGTYYSITASPGHVIRHGDEYLQFFSSTTRIPESRYVQRTLGIARTEDLDSSWEVDPAPLVPVEEQIENSSLYYEESIKTWFLFTNHIGVEEGKEFTDAIWVYWSRDLDHWDPKNKAIVLDGKNCTWSEKCIGLPSAIRAGDRLALFYDAPGGTSTSHMKRHVGLAWLDLPLTIPGPERTF